MCELLGMNFNEPISPTFTFRGFTKRGDFNPDGWGIALYPNGGLAVQIIKEPVNAYTSRLANYIINTSGNFTSKIYISHVRQKSRGESVYRNTHPFSRELNGRDYCFAHNGTLTGSYKYDLLLGMFNPIGETDSEYVFCHIMEFVKNRIINRSWDQSSFSLLYEKFREINAYGKFNCLFSDGEHLFCYHDKCGYNGLHYVRRVAPFTKVKLADEDFEIDLKEEKKPEQAGYIVATRPLTNENWIGFARGQFVVFKDGKIIYNKYPIGETELRILKAIRTTPHKVSIEYLSSFMNLPYSTVVEYIKNLRDNGYIKQDSTDMVDPLDKNANYYTVKERRDEIDSIIKNF
ncbi:MAG TPA: winged helix-turn-helix transcriptional regulator [Clostridiaceae bacterium]|nr:winged helix-turn-helix transcriptional regulator [Clostridiaceae bacterium]